jgi:predicted amidohydrolase YtcJ
MKYLIFIFMVFPIMIACTDAEKVMILHDINGYTFQQDELIEFEALAIQNGKVLAIGTMSDMAADFPDANLISGNGSTVLPGLIDAHAHVMGLGFQELDIDVSGIESLEETLQIISEFAKDNPDIEWLTGRGWNQVLWESNEFPTANDLDAVSDGRPVWLTRVDGHAGWANNAAMDLAGITNETEDPQGGRIIRDGNGEATGIFIDTAMDYISEIIPERTSRERETALELATEKMASNGITSVHDARVDDVDWELYTRFADQGRLKTRIYAMIGGTGATFDKLAENGPVENYADHMLALRSVKITADGALGSRGAALLEEYDDDPGNRGLFFYDQGELNEMVFKGVSLGFQMNIHAIGDAANRQVLNAFEFVARELENGDLRHRVEHAQIVHPDDIPRFAELGIIASMQPTHATSDMNMAEDRVGQDRIRGGYAWRTFLDQGTVIAGGSDFPVEAVNPFYGLYAAVTRQDFHGNPPGGWYPEHSLSREEALKMFTVHAAYAAHQEEIIGSLTPGKYADFIMIDKDYFEIETSDIWKIKILETWVAGERVYTSY